VTSGIVAAASRAFNGNCRAIERYVGGEQYDGRGRGEQQGHGELVFNWFQNETHEMLSTRITLS
jgi:hypothetical protein